MKSLFFAVCLCVIAANVIGQPIDDPDENLKSQTEHENGTFIEELTDVALRVMESYSEYGHKLIRVEAIGNVSRASVQNTMDVWACRFNDTNQRKEIEAHPEYNVSHQDFEICDECKFQINRTENGTFSAVEYGCASFYSDIFATEVSERNTVKVQVCRINDVNVKREMEALPEIKFTFNGFYVCSSCEIKMNKNANVTSNDCV